MHGTWGDQLPFFVREPYQLTFLPKKEERQYIRKTNVDDLTFTMAFLVRQGYGTMKEIQSLDTPEFLDLVEVEMIRMDIERHKIDGGD